MDSYSYDKSTIYSDIDHEEIVESECEDDIQFIAAMPEAISVIRELAAEVERLRGIIEFNGYKGEL